MSAAVRDAIMELCRVRAPGKSICPSDVARGLSRDGEGWRQRMPEVRETAAQLARDGLIVVTQRGQPVDIETARGPVRLRLADHVGDGSLRCRAPRQRSEQ